jgi:predicted DNA-binding protein
VRAMTVRFPDATYERLEVEAKTSGVSAAQFVREATLARIAYTAGRRGEEDYEAALRWGQNEVKDVTPGRKAAQPPLPAF